MTHNYPYLSDPTLSAGEKHNRLLCDVIKQQDNRYERIARALQPIPRKAGARAHKALVILLWNSRNIGSRAWDDCFEMGDGAEVLDLVFKRLVENDFDFHDLSHIAQMYFGEKSFRKYVEKAEQKEPDLFDLVPIGEN